MSLSESVRGIGVEPECDWLERVGKQKVQQDIAEPALAAPRSGIEPGSKTPWVTEQVIALGPIQPLEREECLNGEIQLTPTENVECDTGVPYSPKH
jgi:hypothetical protein